MRFHGRLQGMVTESSNPLRGIYPILNVTPESDPHAVVDLGMSLVDAGIRLVQVRPKRIPEDTLLTLLDDIVNMLRGAGLTVILNDYVELVRIVGADGVHLGLEDFPVQDARRVLGRGAIIGATCRNPEQAVAAAVQGASYVAAGSVYQSSTKSGVPIVGLEGLRAVASVLAPRGIPVCAIGGITRGRLKEVHAAGAQMVAVVDAIQNANDPVEAAKDLVEEWEHLSGSSVC